VIIGAGTAQAESRLMLSGGPMTAPGVAIDDFDGDGIADLAGIQESGRLELRRGKRDGSFGAPTVISVDEGTAAAGIIAADFDSDGHADLAVTLGGRLALVRGNGDGTFRDAEFMALERGSQTMAATDFNLDGWFDLAVSNTDSGSVSILLGDGHGGFRKPVHVPAHSRPQHIAADDVNNDGKPDLFIGAGSEILIWTGRGDGTFAAIEPVAIGQTDVLFSLVDIDLDGNVDIMASNSTAVVISKGKGAGQFERFTTIPRATKGDGSRAIGPPGVSIMMAGGSPQSTPVNTPFPQPLRAAVIGPSGPMGGYPVLFTGMAAPSGAFVTSLPPIAINADPTGMAMMFVSANGIPGSYTILASSAIPGPYPNAAFFLTNTGSSAPPGSITAGSGSGQSAMVNTNFAQPLVVTVRDINNQPMGGVSVSFAGPPSGASANVPPVVTNLSGQASATATANATAGGPYLVTASVNGLVPTAQFSLTNTPGPSSIAVSSGAGQSTVVNTAFPQRVEAIVRDLNNNPVPGVTVTFSAPNTVGAPGAILGAASASTNTSGIAGIGVIANATIGTYNVTATVSTSAGPVQTTFALTNSAATVTYTVTDTGIVGSGYGINSSGQVTGTYGISGQQHGFFYSSGTVTDMGTLGGSSSNGWGINTSGVVAGDSFRAGFSDWIGMTYNAGTRIDLGTIPGGLYSSARGINDAGQVVGYAATAPSPHAVIWNGLAITDLGTLGGAESYGYGINSSGRATGMSTLPGNASHHAFLWNGSSLVDIGATGGTFSTGRGINDSNHVVGAATFAGLSNHAFFYNGSLMTDLGTLGGSASEALAINNSGTIAGWSHLPGDSVTHAFVYSSGQMKDLNGLIDPASGWTLVRAQAINASGQITGWGMLGGQQKVFILTPGGAAASVTVNSGSPQSAAVGSPFVLPLQVVVRNSSNNPVAGATVNFAVIPSGNTGAVLSSFTAFTDGNGLASITATANAFTGGPYTVRATVSGVLAPADFSLTNVPATASISLGTNYLDGQFSITVNGLTTNYTGNSGPLAVNANDTVVFSHPAGVQTPNALTRYHWHAWNGFTSDPLTLPKPITTAAFAGSFLAAYKLTINGTAVTSPASSDGFYTQTASIFIPVTVTASCSGGGTAQGLRISHPAFYQVNGPLVPASAVTTVPNGSVITMDRPWTVDPICTVPVTINSILASNSTAYPASFAVTGAGCTPGTYTSPMTFSWTPAANCSVSFASVAASPGTVQAPGSWNDGNFPNPRTIVVPSAAATYTISYSPQHQLCLTPNPVTAGTFSFSSVANQTGCFFLWAGPQTITPSAASGFSFLNWSGSASGSANPLNVNLNGPLNIVGEFFSFTLTASANTSTFGQPVTLTGTVTPSSLSGGKVTFYDGTTILGIAAVSAGSAQITTTMLPAGVRSLKAYYSGNGTAPAATSAIVPHTVNTASSSGFVEAPNSPFSTPGGPISITGADLDGNGLADLAVANTNSDAFTRMLGNGAASFTSTTFSMGNQAVSVATGDFNEDGVADVITANQIANNVTIRRASGATFLAPTAIAVGNRPQSVVVADFNGDGHPDFATANLQDSTVSVMLGNGTGVVFTPAAGNPFTVGASPRSIAAGDFNGDGRADIVTANSAGTRTVLVAQASGGFTSSTLTGSGLSLSVVIADVDNDGKLDIIGGLGNGVSVHRGDGAGGFTPAPGSPFTAAGTSVRAVATGDFNGDGKIDIATANMNPGTDNVGVFTGNGSGGFTALSGSPFAAGNNPSALAVRDFNGDGRADIAIANLSSNNVTVLLGTSQAPQTITFPTIANRAFGSGPVTLNATASSGLPVTYTSTTPAECTVSGSTVTLVSVGGCTITATQPGNSNYLPAAPVSRSFQITKGTQTITFPAPADTPRNNGPVTLTATASSGLPVSYISLSPFACSVSGSTVTLLIPGTCRIMAIQMGDTDWLPALPQIEEFEVLKGSQTIVFPQPPNTPLTSGPVPLSATSSAGLSVTYSSTTLPVCTVSATAVTLVSVGTCSITANQPGNGLYNAATPVTRNFQVTQGSQTITFPQPPSTALTAGPVAMTATASSGLPVGYASTTLPVCTVSGSSVTLVSAGACSITATQAGNANYAAATAVTRTFTVNKANQSITFPALPNRSLTSGPVTLSGSASSGLAVTFASTTPAVCSVAGVTATLLSVGTCSITANQGGNANYLAAATVTRSFNVTQGAQTITFNNPGSKTVLNSPLTLNASASSGLIVTLTSNTTSICTVSGNVATLLAAGTCTITATQAGNVNYSPAAAVPQSFAITPLPSTIVLTKSASSTNYGASLTLTATVSPATATGVVTFFEGVNLIGSKPLTGGSAAISTILLSGGSHTLTAYYAGGGGYLSSTSAALTHQVIPGPVGAAFGGQTVYAGVNNVSSVAVGDFNGDGKPDLVMGSDQSGNSFVSVLLGAGNGSFGTHSNYTAGNRPRHVTVGDFNGDGYTDLAVANFNAQTVSVFTGTGTGTFNPQITSTAANFGTTTGVLAAADFNGDGKADLAVASFSGDTVNIILGNGNGSFAAPVNYPVGDGPNSLAIADFDGDGFADLAVANSNSNTLSVLRGLGGGTFASAVTYNAGTQVVTVAAADFNGDGKPDLVAANRSSSNISVLINNGSGAFGAAVNYAAGSQPGGLAVEDFDGDGKVDIAVGSTSSTSLTFFHGNGNGTFAAAGSFLADLGVNAIGTGDFNGDGRPDMVTTNQFSPYVKMMFQTGPLGVSITNRTGILSSRTWTVEFKNYGSITAPQVKLEGLTVSAPFSSCPSGIPAIVTQLPLSAGNLPPAFTGTVNVTINFAGCPANQSLIVDAVYSVNGISVNAGRIAVGVP